MKLYHGTSETVARKALVEGLKPRQESGSKGNWNHTVSSDARTVYMTEVYAGYFACHVAGEEGERWGILEVDVARLDPKRMMPDEDFLEQATRGRRLNFRGGAKLQKMEMKQRTEWFRQHLTDFQHVWQDSLNHLGTVAYMGAIPPEAITRAAVYDSKSNNTVSMASIDPSIMLLNHKFCQGKYIALTRWLIGDSVTPAEFVGWGEEALAMYPKAFRENIERELQNRSGWEQIKP